MKPGGGVMGCLVTDSDPPTRRRPAREIAHGHEQAHVEIGQGIEADDLWYTDMQPRPTSSIHQSTDEPGSCIHGYVRRQQREFANGAGHVDSLGRKDPPRTGGQDGGLESASTEVTLQLGDDVLDRRALDPCPLFGSERPGHVAPTGYVPIVLGTGDAAEGTVF